MMIYTSEAYRIKNFFSIKLIFSTLRYLLIAIGLIAAPQLALAKGWLDSSSTYKRYIGWACKPGSPEIVGIHIYASGQFIGGGNAAAIRELAVQSACSSSHSSHGFDIQINDINPSLLDGTIREVIVYAIYANNTSEKLENTPTGIKFEALPGKERPTTRGDVVGRDLDYSWAGPLNYFGHIGIWDGATVIEATGAVNGDDTLKITSWANFSNNPTLWKTLTPIAASFRQQYCDDVMCKAIETSEFKIAGVNLNASDVRDLVARSAYVKYLIGASYTRTAGFTSSKQGQEYLTKQYCSPFSTSCTPTLVSTKPSRGVYRCETFVLDAWASSATNTGYKLLFQTIQNGNPAVIDNWNKQISYLTSYLRLMTPKAVYDNLQQQWW